MPRLRPVLLGILTAGMAIAAFPAILPYAIVAGVSAVAGCYFGFMLCDRESED